MNPAPAADQLLGELIASAEHQSAPAPLNRAIQKVRYTHDAMIDLIVERPEISQNEIAAVFGYTAGWVSIIASSDAFQARLAERRAELVDPVIRASLEERFRAVTSQSLRVLAEKLSKPAHEVPDNLALRAAELGAKALGMGAVPIPAAPPGGDHLADLSGRLVHLLRRQTAVVVEEAVIVPPEAA